MAEFYHHLLQKSTERYVAMHLAQLELTNLGGI